MKESFSELYSRLYRENFEELEALRKQAKKSSVAIIFIVLGVMVLVPLFPLFLPILCIGIPAVIITAIVKTNNTNNKIATRGKTYSEVFKEKVVGPIIENAFLEAQYNAKSGISQLDYNRARYKEGFDRFHSEDLVIAPLRIQDEVKTFITFSEVHTERISTDSDGNTTYSTVFHGLAGSFLLPKSIGTSVYIRSNGRISRFNKNKVDMDMSEFEKLFDVECEDKILAMRILTADVMTEMVELYQKYKYKFEISIINDTVYMRLRTGPVFEPSVFGNSMEYKQLEKYYLILRTITNISSQVYDTIYRLEI